MLKRFSPKTRIVAVVIALLLTISFVMRSYVFGIKWQVNLVLLVISGSVMIVSWLFFSRLHTYLNDVFPYERGIMLRMVPQVLLTFGFLTFITWLIIPYIMQYFSFQTLIHTQYTDLARVAGYTAHFLVVVLLNVLQRTFDQRRKFNELVKAASRAGFDSVGYSACRRGQF